MVRKGMLGFLCASLVCVTHVYGQIVLQNISSRSARDSRMVTTHIDTLTTETKTDHGLATTTITMVLRPGAYQQLLRYDNTDGKSVPVYVSGSTSLDSIEISSWFQLPTDWVADSMWLWVDGKPQQAYIQDRALAAAQYQQIVGRRLDPAILQFSGNGSYDLRIFPAATEKARKIAIRFHHTFDDDSLMGTSPLITASLPISFDTLPYYYYQYSPTRSIKFMKSVFSCADHRTYTVDIPGLGQGTYSDSKPLELKTTYITKLLPGTVSTVDPSGTDEFVWVGSDRVNTAVTVGFTTDLTESDITFEPEPDTRIIVMDMRNRYWNWSDYYTLRSDYFGYSYAPSPYYTTADIWLRAQKLAILSIQNYVSSSQKFNLVFAGTTVKSVFDAPVAGSAENIAKALKAILDAAPSKQASTLGAMSIAAAQAPKGIAILISDLIQPYDYYTNDKYSTVSVAGSSYDKMIDSIRAVVKSSSITLFTIDDNWQLAQIGSASGGYRLSGILNSYNVPYKYAILDGKRVQIPQMPSLFGSTNPTGLCDLSVSVDGWNDMVYTNDTYGYYGGVLRGDVVMMAKRSGAAKMVLPGYSQNAALIRVAGRVAIDKFRNSVDIAIAGKMGGLRFSRNVKGSTNYSVIMSSTQPQSDVQWAFRKTENLATDNWQTNAAAIKVIGKEYHIVTRSTSLLALEPGMTLWEDTLNPVSSQGTRSGSELSGAPAATDAAIKIDGAPTTTQGSGIGLDGISISALLAPNGLPVVSVDIAARSSLVTVSTKSRTITLTLASAASSDLVLTLHDLRGRVVASRTIGNSLLSSKVFSWNLDSEGVTAGSGFYTLYVKNGSFEKRFRVSLINR